MADIGEPSSTYKAVDRKLPTRPRNEIARLGDEIYERDIRAQVEADHDGEIVSIDVDTGKWAIGDDTLEAVDRLRSQRQESNNVWSLRVGHRAVHKFGGQVLGARPVILGTVNASYEAVITVTVQGPSGLTRQFEAVIDTGFSGFVSLPPALVTELGTAVSDQRIGGVSRRQLVDVQRPRSHNPLGLPVEARLRPHV